eukprot:70156_1
MSLSYRDPSLSSSRPSFRDTDNVGEEEEQKEDEHIQKNRSTSSIPPHISSGWLSLHELYHSEDLKAQTQQTLTFLSFVRNFLLTASPQTQICVCLFSFGLMLILIQLPRGILFSIVLLSIGISGILTIATQQYLKFAQETGLISFLRPGIIKDFILNGSIVDIFYEIRNSNLGIPDFLLSQILPLDEPEREIIFERLPDITRNLVSTEGLIYLTPQLFQTLVLPQHLQRDNHIHMLERLQRSEQAQMLEHASPYAAIDFSQFANQPLHQSPILHASSEQQPLEHGDDLVTNTRNEIEQAGMKWLWKQHQEEEDVKVDGNNNDNTLWENSTKSAKSRKSSSYVLQPNTSKNETEVIESVSTPSTNDEPENAEKRDIVDDEYESEQEHQQSAPPSVDMDTIPQDEIKERKGSWFGQIADMFSSKMLGTKARLGSKPIPVLKAVIDTRMKELALQVIRSVWKSPFYGITDAQLVVIFVCCVGCVSYYLTKNKKARGKFVKSIKYIGFMTLVWISILSFIELNVRRRSKIIKRIYQYINNQLFHSKQHKAVRDRKKSYSDLTKRSYSMRMNSTPMSLVRSKMMGSLSRQNLLNGRERQIRLGDKKSRFSRTMPFIQSNDGQPNTPRNDDDDSTSIMSEFSSPQTPMSQQGAMAPFYFDTPQRGKFKMSLMDIPDDKKLRESIVNRTRRAKSVSFA